MIIDAKNPAKFLRELADRIDANTAGVTEFDVRFRCGIYEIRIEGPVWVDLPTIGAQQ